MNRLQKVAALNKVAKLKRAAAALLLVRRGYLSKNAYAMNQRSSDYMQDIATAAYNRRNAALRAIRAWR